VVVLLFVTLVSSWAFSQTTTPPGATAPEKTASKQKPATEQPLPAKTNPVTTPNPAPTPNPTTPVTPEPIFEAKVTDVQAGYPEPNKHPKEVHLGDFVVLTFDQPWAKILNQQKPPNTNKLGLYINDLFMKGLEPMGMPDQPKSVMFQLKRNDDNRPAWSVFFGRKSSISTGSRDDETLKLTVGLQDGSWAAQNPDHPLYLEYLPGWTAKAVLLISFLVALLTIVMGIKSSMLRDSGDPRTDGKPGTFSLGRCQMALWFVTVVFAYLFNYAVTGDISPIPQGVLILMGIGAGTALGSAVIDVNKRTATKADLLNWNAQNVALPQQIKDLKTKIDSTPAGDSNLPALQQQLLTSQQQLASVTAQLAQIPTTMVQPSEGFIRDVLSDANGISFHRLQVFGWTLVFWAVFATTLFKTITMTDFDTTQLALLGISGGTYLGFKVQEKQS